MKPTAQRIRPLHDVLEAMVGRAPPAFVGQARDSSDLSEDENQQLQDWCADNCRPHWLTGIGLIEAADLQVNVAIANGNISWNGKTWVDHA